MPIFELQAPDGSTYEVDAPDQGRAVAAFKKMSTPAAAPQAEQAPSRISGFNAGVASGLTGNFSDELFAGAMTPIEMGIAAAKGTDAGKGIGERISAGYGRALEKNRALEKEARAQSPVASTVGDVAGGLITGGALMKGGATLLNAAKPTLPSMVGRGAAEGAAYGGVYGFGAGEGIEDRTSRAGIAAAFGAGTGGVLGGVAARGARKAAEATVPSSATLKSDATKAYKAADDAGLAVSQKSFSGAVDDIAAEAKKAGIDRTIHPNATAAIGRLREAADAGDQTLSELDILRRVAQGAAGSVVKDERRIGRLVIEKLDDYVNGLKPGDVVAGNAKAGVEAIKDARALWTKKSKAEVLEALVEKAKNSAPNFSGSGMENALRTQFRQLANNPNRMRQFSPAEQAAIKKVARGGPIENIARALGKFAPTGIVSTALGGGVGFQLGGPVGAGALLAAGAAGRTTAKALTKRNAAIADLLVRSGGNMPKRQAIGRDNIVKALLGGLRP
jgi:hypothetical protein